MSCNMVEGKVPTNDFVELKLYVGYFLDKAEANLVTRITASAVIEAEMLNTDKPLEIYQLIDVVSIEYDIEPEQIIKSIDWLSKREFVEFGREQSSDDWDYIKINWELPELIKLMTDINVVGKNKYTTKDSVKH